MPVNRKLNITVTFSAQEAADGSFGGGATYTQTGSTPDMGNIVKTNGEIDLDQALSYDTSAYNNNVDIEFTLATPCTVTPGNTTIPIIWATQYGAGMTVEIPEGSHGTLGEMEVVKDPNNPNLITLKDKDDDSNTYNYKPAVELVRPNVNNYYISLDPKIVNRPT